MNSDVVAGDAVVAFDVANGLDNRLGEGLGGESAGALAGHAGFGDLLEYVVVDFGFLYLLGDGLEGDLGGFVIAFDNRRRVDVLFDQVLGLAEKVASDDSGRRRAVTDFLFLGVGDFDDHLGRRMLDIHLLEDGCAVVGDDDFTARVDEHFIHSAGAECRPDRLGNGLAGHDVGRLGIPPLGSLTVLAHDEHRLSAHASLLCHG